MSDKKPTLLSKYRLMACLGRGGMAEVYLAVSQQPHGVSKLQVLKTLRRDLSDSERPEYLQMFQDEARLAARLNHPNIVQSHDVGFEEPAPFIAMEYLDGQPLSRVQERQWSTGQVNSWGVELLPICQVLDALDYAHTLTHYDGTPLNVVHRDVSPQNIFITYTGHTKLVDFGIAKTLDSKKTRAGVIKGKVAYMSPEQVRGQLVDHRSDVYSVGVILWETVARQCMHGAEPVLDILNRVVEGRLPRLKEVAPHTPDELCLIAERALACNPDSRYANASAFREDLDRFLEGKGRATERELGKVVSDLFAKERQEINQAIRTALAQPASAADPDTLRITPILSVFSTWNETPAPDRTATDESARPRVGQTDSHTEKPIHLENAPSVYVKRGHWVVLGATSLLALAIWLGYSRTGTQPEADSPNAATSIRVGQYTELANTERATPEGLQTGVTVATQQGTTASATAAVTAAPSPASTPTARPSSVPPPATTATPRADTRPASTSKALGGSKALPTPTPPPVRNKDPFDHDFSPGARKRSSGGTLDTSNPWK